MSAEEYLRQNYKLNEEIEYLKQEELRLRNLAEGVQSVIIKDDVVQGGKRKDKTDYVDEYVDNVCDELKRLRLAFVKLNAEITKRILSIQNYDERMVLRLRYLEFKSWEEIEIELGMSNSKVHRVHPRALINFGEKYAI